MAYSIIEGVSVYACGGGLSGTVSLPEDPVWEGALCFPHAPDIAHWSAGVDNEYVVIANGSGYPQPTAYYTQLLAYCPDFDQLDAVCNGPVSGTSGTLTALLPGLVLAWPGVEGAGLHVVTKEGSDRAYAYTVSEDTVSDAVSARVQEDGSVAIEGTPLCLPRLGATRNLYRFYGCLISGVREDGAVSSVADCAVYGLRVDPGYGIGLRTSLYLFRQMDAAADTAVFLDEWLSVGRPSPSCFLQGLLAGQRLRAWAGGLDRGPSAGPPSGGRGPYHEGSFLAGLCAGCASRGWGGLPD